MKLSSYNVFQLDCIPIGFATLVDKLNLKRSCIFIRTNYSGQFQLFISIFNVFCNGARVISFYNCCFYFCNIPINIIVRICFSMIISNHLYVFLFLIYFSFNKF